MPDRTRRTAFRAVTDRCVTHDTVAIGGCFEGSGLHTIPVSKRLQPRVDGEDHTQMYPPLPAEHGATLLTGSLAPSVNPERATARWIHDSVLALRWVFATARPVVEYPPAFEEGEVGITTEVPSDGVPSDVATLDAWGNLAEHTGYVSIYAKPGPEATVAHDWGFDGLERPVNVIDDKHGHHSQ